MKLKIDANILFNKNENLIQQYIIENNLSDIITSSGVYLLKNKVSNKYYVGSTYNYYNRLISLRNSTSHRARIISHNDHLIKQDDIFNWIIILFPTDNYRYWESKIVKLLKTYLPEYGYNKTTTGGLGAPVNNCNSLDTHWINNGVNNYRTRDLILPEGWYPGSLNTSFCKLFLDRYYPELHKRNRDIYTIQELELQVDCKLLDRLNYNWFCINYLRHYLWIYYKIKLKILNQRDFHYVTNLNKTIRVHDLILPEGYYPGKGKNSWCYKFFSYLNNFELANRNKEIYSIEPREIKVTLNELKSIGATTSTLRGYLKTSIKRFYNIDLKII